jgi:hypothetical protein
MTLNNSAEMESSLGTKMIRVWMMIWMMNSMTFLVPHVALYLLLAEHNLDVA